MFVYLFCIRSQLEWSCRITQSLHNQEGMMDRVINYVHTIHQRTKLICIACHDGGDEIKRIQIEAGRA